MVDTAEAEHASKYVRFAMAIAGDPEMLMLDEPTAAMDVEARREFWTSMYAFAARGHTILFATHYLEEAEASASRLIIIAKGQVIADGTVQDIQARYGESRVMFTRQDDAVNHFELPGIRQYHIEGNRVTLHTSDADATVRALVDSDIPWNNLEVKSNDLEETFINLVHTGKGEAPSIYAPFLISRTKGACRACRNPRGGNVSHWMYLQFLLSASSTFWLRL